ncbi:MAG: HupE/UreJ family protein [Chitinophagaceae bacterium]
MDVSPDRVGVELHIPLSELALAYGANLAQDPETLLQRMEPQLKEYILAHTHAFVKREQPWLVEINSMDMDMEEQIVSGPPFWELRVHLVLLPQQNENTRHFFFDYDAVVHQVANHIIFVTIRSDWETGRADTLTADSNPMTIRINSDNTVHPLEINIDNGSWWTGFKNMVSMGMLHIKEGTDHLMFLLVLLLPSTLLVQGGKWDGFGGVQYSVVRLLKIVTAFTVGHSATLLLGALGVIAPPSQIIESLIAVSILVSALHALHPLFPGKEFYVSGGFGLIHGMAFSTVLSNMHLGGSVLVLSILGFNIGIELMQLFIISVTVPWLILMSVTPYYKWFRMVMAVLSAVVALAWIAQRGFGKDSFITEHIDQLAADGKWLILGVAVLAIILYVVNRCFSSFKKQQA